MAVTDSNRSRVGKDAIFRVEGLRKDYVMGEVTVSALRAVTLDVREGEFMVILGPSGSGKSTLLNIIGGLDVGTDGDVFFRSANLSELGEKELTLYRRHHIGFVFQFYNLMPNLTASENVEMATEISKDPMTPSEALALVSLSEREDHFPSQLSGGEQQRVAIARAVAKRPEILLCDEPTGALDISTGKVVLDVLSDVNQRLGTTLIVITHNSTIGQMADRVVHMRDGRIHQIVLNETRLRASELDW